MKQRNFRTIFAKKIHCMKQFPASAVAYAFIKKGIESGLFVTQLKIQKMVYFANGVHLAKYDVPLINETVQAWKYGPVIAELYQVLKAYGNSPITDPLFLDFIGVDKEYSKLDDDAERTINYSWEATKSVSAENLVRWTHKEGSPWKTSWTSDEKNSTIDNDKIKVYFKSLIFPADVNQ